MLYKLIEDEFGEFTKSGINYTLLEATNYIDTPEGRNIDCNEFENIEVAIAFYGLEMNEINE